VVDRMRRVAVVSLLGVVAAGLLFVPLAAAADAGDLDSSFGTGGLVTTEIGPNGSGISDIALQADRKIVAFGQADYAPGQTGFAVARYLPSGGLDSSFGASGVVLTAIGGLLDIPMAGLVQPDGRLVAVGFAVPGTDVGVSDFAVTRYLSNGDLDTSFDGDGGRTISVGEVAGEAQANAVALQADGKLVIAGVGYYAGGSEVIVVRLNADGSSDSTFDGDGIFAKKVGASSSAEDVQIQADGKIVIAVDQLGTTNLNVLRLNSDGTPDTGFDSDGLASYALFSADGWTTETRRVVLRSGGKIMVAADRRTSTGYSGEILLAQFNANGTPDTSAFLGQFAHSLKAKTSDTGEVQWLADVLVQPDGKIILTGSRGPNGFGALSFYVQRLQADGLNDSTFACNGVQEWPVASNPWVLGGAALDSNGTLVAGGYSISQDETTSDFGLARFLLSGTADCPTSAGPRGVAPPSVGGGGGGGGGSGAVDLSLFGSVSPSATTSGGTVTWTLKAANLTSSLALGVHVDITLPPGATVVSSRATRGPGCPQTATNGVLICSLDFLNNQALFGEITLVTTLVGTGDFTLRAKIGYANPDPNPVNDSVELTATIPGAQTPSPPPPPRTLQSGKSLTGNAKANTLRGTAFADTLRGLAGSDRLFGLAGPDRLFGGPGVDSLNGGAGKDLIDGGPGNDIISARDGTTDSIRCGTGQDTVTADRLDKIAKDCETVHRR
jgi:uncharacterized delta-60 repeat protein